MRAKIIGYTCEAGRRPPWNRSTRRALTGEDAAYSHVDLVGAELLDRLGVPVGTTCGFTGLSDGI
jgi:hypothetical protein